MELITSDLPDDFDTTNQRHIGHLQALSSYQLGLPSISWSEVERGMSMSRASSFYGEPQPPSTSGMDICMYYYEYFCFYMSFITLLGLFAIVIYLLVYAHQHHYS